MSKQEFENYLTLVSRLLRLNSIQTNQIRDELRDHLENRVSELERMGIGNEEAVQQALAEFGDAASLAQQFQYIFVTSQRRWMMRFATFSIAIVFFLAVLTMAMWPTEARFGTPASAVAEQTDKDSSFGHGEESAPNPFDASETKPPINKNKRLPKIVSSDDLDDRLMQWCNMDYEEVPFAEVMSRLRQELGINVILDQTAMDDSLSEDEPITFRLKDTKLSTALTLMLEHKNSTYVNQDGVLRIISLDVATDPEYFRRKIFNCRQLLKAISETDNRVGKKVMKFGVGAGGGGGGGFFCIPKAPIQDSAATDKKIGSQANQHSISRDSNPSPDSMFYREVTAEEILEEVIRTTIDSDGWDDTNGDGTLMIVSGLLVVTQTEKTLDEIEKFLNELESKIQ